MKFPLYFPVLFVDFFENADIFDAFSVNFETNNEVSKISLFPDFAEKGVK